jgi:hypothetical protein
VLLQDGAPGSDAAAGAVGAQGGSDGSAGAGGSAGASGPNPGAGGCAADGRQDTPLGAGGGGANRDLGPGPGTGGAVLGSGGVTGSGGKIGSGGAGGGAPGSGGKSGDGGAAGTGGSVGTCGGDGDVKCPTGQLCDIVPGCGVLWESPPYGTCQPTGANVNCKDVYAPVCGCDGRTYANDCERTAAGILKFYDGACNKDDAGIVDPGCNFECHTDAAGVTGWYLGDELVKAASCLGCMAICEHPDSWSMGCYALCPLTGAGGGYGPSDLIRYEGCSQKTKAYLTWQAPGGAAGTGPALVLSAAGGWVKLWNNVPGFDPKEAPTVNPDGIHKLTSNQTQELLLLIGSMYQQMGSLPHPGTGGECGVTLYSQLGLETRPETLKYPTPASVSPEMEPLWAWFDELLGTSAPASPRRYCDLAP